MIRVLVYTEQPERQGPGSSWLNRPIATLLGAFTSSVLSDFAFDWLALEKAHPNAGKAHLTPGRKMPDASAAELARQLKQRDAQVELLTQQVAQLTQSMQEMQAELRSARTAAASTPGSSVVNSASAAEAAVDLISGIGSCRLTSLPLAL